MSSEPRLAMLQATTRSFGRSCHRRRWKQRALPPRPSRFRTPLLLIHLRPADYTVECSDEMPMDDATASDNCGEVTIGCPAKPPLAMLQATTRSFGRSQRRTMLETISAADHHRQGHHAPEFTFVPADYTVECSDEMPMDARGLTTAVR